MAKKQNRKSVKALTHEEATRKNIPSAEHQSVLPQEVSEPVPVRYARHAAGLELEKQNRNRDLDPQLVWRGKDEQDWSELVVHAPPLYIQEKVHPKVLIDDLLRRSETDKAATEPQQLDLFADFNGLPDDTARTEFYQHDANWTNRMILGDSLAVMASLAEREGLRGKVQCIYLDPPYGIKFNSNFQWSTTSRDVKDGKAEHITREPEQVKAFRDTWRDGIHSYLTYLRDRLTVCRDLLTDSGSIFVQIGDENVHRVRSLMDEVFGDQNAVSHVTIVKTTGAGSPAIGTKVLAAVNDYLLWYAKDIRQIKYRQIYESRVFGAEGSTQYNLLEAPDGSCVCSMTPEEKNQPTSIPDGWRIIAHDNLTSQTGAETTQQPICWEGRAYRPSKGGWKTNTQGASRLVKSTRLLAIGKTLRYRRRFSDFGNIPINNFWVRFRTSGFSDPKLYVVQTNPGIIQRCILMSTDPGDLILDPTCGSGTTAYVAEQWGRRWITIDTSRVALALARARIMGARYPYYLLADSPEGQRKEAEITRSVPSSQPAHGDIRHGFVYQRVPHITLKSIANNAEIDVIWERVEEKLEPLREQLTQTIAAVDPDWLKNYRAKQNYDVELPNVIREWEVPREAPEDWPPATQPLVTAFWELRIARQKEIDASIAAKADFEYLYDKPYEDKGTVRVAGPFTVESLSPHRVLGVDENDELIEGAADARSAYGEEIGFVEMILDNLRTAGMQQAHKEDKIVFTSLLPWPGELICAEGRYIEGDESTAGSEKRAAIFIGPEYGTVTRPDLVAAAREAGDADFDVLIACAFNYDAHSSEFDKLGRIPVLKARMNADLHMAGDLKNTGKGNLFVIFGEPDIDILEADGERIQVKVNGVDVFHPQTGEVRSDGPEGIACWFIDTDYNEESFFVRHAYFLGANDPYKALKTTLKAEINEEAWASLHSDTSRPFPKPKSGRIAVKVINHLGDEVMKVFRVA
jgi:adenine-specific DNA-methyltransferase